MMTVNIIAVGKLKESYLREACSEYIKRLGAFCKINLVEIDEYKLPDNPSQANITAGIEEEGKRIFAKISQGSYNIPMCIEGQQFSSEDLAEKIDNIASNGISNINLIIGGSYGLSPTIKDMAKLKLSMSKMTFPHQLARVMLLEQIYRVFSINGNTKYHK